MSDVYRVLLSDNLFITHAESTQPMDIDAAPLIGANYAKELAHKLLRFYIQGNAFASQ